jgi:hypothetical protein
MVTSPFRLREDYWETFELHEGDIELLYNHLLESEEPQTTGELVKILVQARVRSEKQLIEDQRTSGGQLYMPKDSHDLRQTLVFPALNWRRGKITSKRAGFNPDIGKFDVIEVTFEDGEIHEYASSYGNHALNTPPSLTIEDEQLDSEYVLEYYQEDLEGAVERELETNPDFVRIAGRWFPRALLVDVNIGHLNLAEAVLDMAGGGPLPTSALLEQLEFDRSINPKLLEFSMDLALQEDERFDEVGSAGTVLWFLKRLEPAEVLEPPVYLRYAGMEYDRSALTGEMLALERELDDELSPLEGRYRNVDNVEVRLIFPHWRAGTLPLSAQLRHLFPTAYEAPRIRFTLVDGETHARIPAWVVRNKRYVYGLQDWYKDRGIQPGSIIRVKAGEKPGEVILSTDSRRQSREWIRTVLVGSDGGIVFAMLKQTVTSTFDDRMVISVPDVEAVDQVWERMQKEHPPFERVVVNTVRELAKLNPQGHVHASELYAAINVVRRTPPGPLLALLASRNLFVHLGDMHYRFVEAERSM